MACAAADRFPRRNGPTPMGEAPGHRDIKSDKIMLDDHRVLVAGAEHWLTEVLQPWLDTGRNRFRRETRNGRTIEFEADHHLFNSYPDRTARELRAFLLSD